MAKARKKRNLPSKTCPVCGRPFTWRKKWEKDWDNVKYCSERCRRTGAAPDLPKLSRSD
ncbi:DUF2256 domain-containing protein [Marinimicrobium sp. C6131]|uniref:DUF2256 domain-containing protein n=1 Tax=Marinimicrobium sp. C6131 TaxID=3022676 RepID=UPI00223E3DE8|nr:DUF2256 domain-containing protein [Marinimicrobium sp. C6131]UZJ44007.1 DUF2256 domain-containing protein [Marinimicrobium sp. C6131]